MLEGESGMTLENRREGLDGRPSAAKDLRFAGTLAAGCVAGVLGVGALTAPLLGWTDWPSASARTHAGALALKEPQVRLAPAHHIRHRVTLPSPAAPVAVTLPLPGAPVAGIVIRPGGSAALKVSAGSFGSSGSSAGGGDGAAVGGAGS